MAAKGSCPPVLGLFQKRAQGDDALFELAALRFKEAELGTEIYAGTRAELDEALRFRPGMDLPLALHLRREIDILSVAGRDEITSYADEFKGVAIALVVHDQREALNRPDEYLDALKALNERLQGVNDAPGVFIEFTGGLAPVDYVEVLSAAQGLERISSCIDIGHIGLWQVRKAFDARHSGRDVCALRLDDPELPYLMGDVQAAVKSAQPAVVDVVRKLCSLGKPLHFHLHDGHPLSSFSDAGVSDHIGFFDTVPLPFEYEGRSHLEPMFGPAGISVIVKEAIRVLGAAGLSFCIETHMGPSGAPLGNEANMFSQWSDRTNAERMNRWLISIKQNAQLVRKVCGEG